MQNMKVIEIPAVRPMELRPTIALQKLRVAATAVSAPRKRNSRAALKSKNHFTQIKFSRIRNGRWWVSMQMMASPACIPKSGMDSTV